MSVEVMTLVWKHANVDGTQLLVMLALADWSNDAGVSWHSVRNIAKKCRVSDSTVQRCLEGLVEAGYLQIERGGQDGVTTNRYFLQTAAIEGGSILLPVSKAGDTGSMGATLYVDKRDVNNSHRNAGAHTHEQSSFVEQPATQQKRAPTSAMSPTRSSSRKAAGVELTLPPTKYRVSDEMWKWAQSVGWRAGREALQFQADACFEHYMGKGEARADWMATLKGWLRRDIGNSVDLKMVARSAATSGNGNGGTDGRTGAGGVGGRGGPGGPGGPDLPRYGYNRAGQPTNRSTALVETARSLAEGQAARKLAASQPERVEEERAREDHVRDYPGDRRISGPIVDESDS